MTVGIPLFFTALLAVAAVGERVPPCRDAVDRIIERVTR